MLDKLQEAHGHVAKIIPFDEATILLPLNEDENRWLASILWHTIEKLNKTGDFPEKEAYVRLYNNLQTGLFMFSKKERECPSK